MVDFYESILYQEMNLVIEDGSTEEVATLLLDFHDKCASSSTEDQIVAAIRTLPKCDLTKCQVNDDEGMEEAVPLADSSAQISEGMESMATGEEPQAAPSGPDPDGWEVVKTRKKR